MSRAAGAGARTGSAIATGTILTGALPKALGGAATKLGTSILGGAATKAIGAALPWVGLGLTAVQLLKPLIGRGRAKADEFVQGVENPISERLKSVYTEANKMAQAGTLTFDQAQQALQSFDTQTGEFETAAKQWEGLGGNYAKVAGQSRTNTQGTFGAWRSDLATYMDRLKPADTPKTGPSDTAPTLLEGEKRKFALGAADQVRKRAMSGGRRSTILTGPLGLMNAAGGRRTTILGY